MTNWLGDNSGTTLTILQRVSSAKLDTCGGESNVLVSEKCASAAYTVWPRKRGAFFTQKVREKCFLIVTFLGYNWSHDKRQIEFF